jgi:3-phenylpropionate/trans-cinnamate dioxygenase ferredoxin subunit
MKRVRVASSGLLAEGEPLSIVVEGQPVMLVRFKGKPFAIGDVCTHQYALLSEGFFDNGYIECPLHQATFDVRSGAVQCGPATTTAKTFTVSEEGGAIYLHL